MYAACLQTTGAICPYHVRVIVQVLWLHVWLSMQICRFHTYLWSLSSRNLPAIYIFYVYKGYLCNARVCNTWKHHGKTQNPITDFALNLERTKLQSFVTWWIILLFFPVTMFCFFYLQFAKPALSLLPELAM